ncbi:MAG TPA: hypothetical protein VGS19_12100 [Streptosporangiaceae bacterium]|nr:hypothetical protein [Streptosporangiaceae bacterium]
MLTLTASGDAEPAHAGLAAPAAVPAGAAPTAAGGEELAASVRAERTLLLLALASRAAYCLHAAAVVGLNITGYRHPGLAGAALAVAVLVSAGLGFTVWRQQAFPVLVTVADAGVAALVLVIVAAAIQRPGQYGSLNWALAYAAGCALWLGAGALRVSGGAAVDRPAGAPTGRALGYRFLLACALGTVYGLTALGSGTADPARTITLVVNASSTPMYFGIAAAIAWVVRRIAAEMAAEQAREQRQHHDLAAMGERERLVGQVHQRVLATLDAVASGQQPWDELRGRARAQVSELRGAFHDPDGCHGHDGLRMLLAALARERAADGWLVELVDEELAAEPAPAVAASLRDALAELVHGPAPGGRGQVRAQVRSGGCAVELVARVPGEAAALSGAVGRAGALLAGAGGTIGLEAAREGEIRVRLQVPT